MLVGAQDIRPGDLQRVAVLGAGAFGQVSTLCCPRAWCSGGRLHDYCCGQPRELRSTW
jgi:hypothetical protein